MEGNNGRAMSEGVEAIVRALGLPVTEDGKADGDAGSTAKGYAGQDDRRRLDVLKDLRRGIISPEDALLRLRQHAQKKESGDDRDH